MSSATVPRDYSLVDPGVVHDVATNAERLGVLYTVAVELTRLVGGWIARTPEMPEKLFLGRMVFEDAEAAGQLEARLRELRVGEEEISGLRRRTTTALKRLEGIDSAEAFLVGLFEVIKPAFVADMRRHLDAAPPHVDEPTVRILTRVIAEQQRQIAKGSALLAERAVDWDGHHELERELRGELWRFKEPRGALLDGEFVGQEPLTLPRPAWPARVTQLAYQDPSPAYPEDFDGAMRRCVHDLVFSETEALDIFGHYVYAFADTDFPWEFHRQAARIAWDEARHVELLLNVLERYGGRLGEFPAKAPGYEEYIRQADPLRKLIMVNVIAEGEVSTDTQTQHREAFRQLGDELSALLKDYEIPDEVVHGRFGLTWARWLADRSGEDYLAAYEHAFEGLEEFKSQHDDVGSESPIPLLRLGVDETGPKRVVNLRAKELVGFSDEEIARLREQAGSTVQE